MTPSGTVLKPDVESQLRRNERIWAGFRDIELRMLAADTLLAAVGVLARDLPRQFPGVDAVSIAWLDPQYELSQLLVQQGGAAVNLSLAPSFVPLSESLLAQLPVAPRLGVIDASARRDLFPGAAPALQSMALVPLVLRGKRVGSLNQASGERGHFTPDTATDLLEHLAAIAALCIDAAVNRARLQRDGLTDTLTQVSNRRFFDRRLHEEVSQWLRHEGELSCLLVDLDRFKHVNDHYGHQTGDQVLQAVAQTLSQGLRASDVLARYGGEEFVLLLPGTGGVRAVEIAERLRAAIAGLTIDAIPGTPLRVSASFGVASLRKGQRGTVKDPGQWLLRQADQALYSAKANGRNCVVAGGEKPLG